MVDRVQQQERALRGEVDILRRTCELRKNQVEAFEANAQWCRETLESLRDRPSFVDMNEPLTASVLTSVIHALDLERNPKLRRVLDV